MRKDKEEQNNLESLKQKYKKAMLKRKVCCHLISASFFVFSISFGAIAATSALFDDFGYKEFNKYYREQQVEQLKEDVENGKIDIEEYKQKSNQIKNYDKSQYVETLDKETQNKYLIQKALLTTAIIADTVALSTIVVSGNILKSQNEKLKNLEEEIDHQNLRIHNEEAFDKMCKSIINAQEPSEDEKQMQKLLEDKEKEI